MKFPEVLGRDIFIPGRVHRFYTLIICGSSDTYSNNYVIFVGTYIKNFFGLVCRALANDPEDLGSIPGWVIAKIFKMVLDNSLLNTQQYMVCIKGKVEQSWERSSLPLHLGVVAIEKGAFRLPSTTVANFTLLSYIYICVCVCVCVCVYYISCACIYMCVHEHI